MRRDIWRCALSPSSGRRWAWLSVIVGAVVAPAHAATPAYTINFPGLYDEAHKSSVGFFVSGMLQERPPSFPEGTLVGFSNRYGTSPGGASAWAYEPATRTTAQLGLYFDQPDGYYKNTQPVALNSRGEVVGFTTGNFNNGEVNGAWYYDPIAGRSTQIGLFTSLGQHDYPLAINEQGLVAGAWTPQPGNLRGYLWAYTPSTNQTKHIGLEDLSGSTPEPPSSEIMALSATSHIVGLHKGQNTVVWQYDASTDATTRLGLTTPEYTLPNGSQFSRFDVMNESGQTGGTSRREFATTLGVVTGSVGWIYDPVSKQTRRAGLTRPDESPSQFEHDRIDGISVAGFAWGESTFAVASGERTVAPWIYDAATGLTTRLGYFDAAHTLRRGQQVSEIQFHDDLRIVGHSNQTDTFIDPALNSAWVYDRMTGVTTRLGLLDGNGTRESRAMGMSPSGFITGLSRRGFDVTTSDAWIYNPHTQATTAIGQTVAAQLGLNRNQPLAINAQNQVVGGEGHCLWLYDPSQTGDGRLILPPTDESFLLTMFDFKDSGFLAAHSFPDAKRFGWVFDPASTSAILLNDLAPGGSTNFLQIKHLNENGTAIGEYDAYQGNLLLGRRGFLWNPQLGFRDLASLVSGGSDAFHWDGFLDGLTHVDEKLITGSGHLAQGERFALALQLIPEPATWSLAALSCATIAAGRRRLRHDRSPQSQLAIANSCC